MSIEPPPESIPAPGAGLSAADVATTNQELGRLRGALARANARRADDQERENELRYELQHSVRNMLGVVRSIFERSKMTSRTIDELSDHFQGRLDVIGRYQLSRSYNIGGPYDLETMIRDELLTVHAADDPRIALEGLDMSVGPEPALVIALALHELITNSIKFGVLSSANDRGRILIRWGMQSDVFEFEWRENGMSVLSPAPLRTGFGREYLGEAVPYELGGTTQFSLSPGELSCTFNLPPLGVANDTTRPAFWLS